MDVAYYISELLVQHGEVNVPGLGCFNAVRKNGYYNENEATFYPPQNIVKFDKTCVDDGVFYSYIAKKKNISLASSQYFTEKYINRLKEHALSKDVTLSDLGWLHLDGDDVSFRPVGVLPNDGTFYGYPQIKLNKYVKPEYEEVVNQIPEYIAPAQQDEPIQYVPETFMVEPGLYEPQAYQNATDNTLVEAVNEKVPAQQEELFDEDGDLLGKDRSKTTTYVRVVIALLIVALLFALIVFGLYKYDPTLFVEKNAPAVIAAKHDSVKAVTPTNQADTSTKTVDTTKATSTVKADTTIQKPTLPTVSAANDTLTQTHYELLGGAFGTEAEANEAIGNYKKIGIEAHILRNVPGKLYKVTLGTFFTDKDAINAKNTLVSTKKISEGNIIVQPFHPKKIKP